MTVVKKLSTKHRQLMRELASGKRLGEACEGVGLSLAHASTIVNSDIFKYELNVLLRDIRARFVDTEGEKQAVEYHRDNLVNEAKASIDTIISLRDEGSSESIKLKSAQDLLNRAGVKAPEEIVATAIVETDESVKSMLSTLIARRAARDEAIE
jgi:hypothetical protein